MSIRLQAVVTVLHATILCAWLASHSSAAADDERQLDALRARRQYDAAEKYCTDRLAERELSAAERADLTIELSRTLAEHAAASKPAAQTALWNKARQVVDDFQRQNPGNPKLLLVRMQGALAASTQGELARENAELAGATPAALEAARAVLRSAISQLRKLSEAVAAETERRGRGAAAKDDGQLTAAQLASVAQHVRAQWSRALRNQALCYPVGTPDRINALTQALELLPTIARQDRETPLVWSSRLDEVACWRLLEDYPKADKLLAQWEQAKPPAQVVPRLRAERIRLEVARGHIDEALAEAGLSIKMEAGWADANGAQLEAFLAAWQRAQQRHDTEDAAHWERAAVEQVRSIEKVHGGAWLRRAENLFARSLARSAGTDSAATLLRAAQSFYRGGQWDEALDAYDRATRRARESKDDNQAFEIAYSAAALEQEREHHREAIDRFVRLAQGMPRHPRAAEAHLLAVHSAAQWAQRETPPHLEEYETLLRKQVATWPQDATASQAWWWLGRVLETRQSWTEAIAALRHVDAEHQQYAAAVEAIGRCYEGLLAKSRADGNLNAQAAKEALRYFQQVIAPGGKTPAEWTPGMQAAALASARISLRFVPRGAAQAEQVLTTALRGAKDAPPDWQAAARVWLVPALAAQGRLAEAEAQLQQVPISVGNSLLLVETLDELARDAKPQERKQLSALSLTVISDLLARRDELDDATRQSLTRRQASALATSGKQTEAIDVLEALARANPRDGQTQEELASLLASSDDAASLQAALVKWREVAGKCRPGSPRWFRAQHAIAEVQLRLGDAAQSRATIKRVATSYPEFGGPEMKAKFQQLLAERERVPASDAK